MPLLLVGALTEENPQRILNAMKVVGALLWDFRNEQVAEDWLTGSEDCSGWYGLKNLDVLKSANALLKKHTPAEWGVTVEHHAYLMTWCEQMMTRRAELKSAKWI